MNIEKIGFGKIVVGCVAAGVAIAAGVGLSMPDRYVSTSVLRVGAKADSGVAAELVNQACRRVLSRESLSELIEKRNLYAEERLHLPLEDVVERMRSRDIRVSPSQASSGKPSIFIVIFSSAKPEQLQEITRELTARLIEATPTLALEVIDAASLPRSHGPARWRITSAGGGVGLLLAGLVGALRRFKRSKR